MRQHPANWLIDRTLRLLPLVAALFWLTSCATRQGSSDLVGWLGHPNPTPVHFTICHGYGCQFRTTTGLDHQQWAQVTALFQPPAETALEEQQRIAQAIALMEKLVGALTGTDADSAEAKPIVFDAGQMDCIDETVNTSTYIRLIEHEGLLHWYRLSTPARRGYFIDGNWPHNTAVIKETRSNRKFAVDSYFFDNGQPPSIILLDSWLNGWRPT